MKRHPKRTTLILAAAMVGCQIGRFSNIKAEEYMHIDIVAEVLQDKLETHLEPIKKQEGQNQVEMIQLIPIDPITNPAEDNWLSREVAKQVGKQVVELNQEDFNQIRSIWMFGDSNITDMPSQIGNLINLEELEIYSGGQMNEIAEELKNLIHLRVLSLPGQNIKELGPITTLTELKVLNLSNNEDIDLSGINQCNQLAELTLSGCNLTNLESIKGLKELKVLNLSNNEDIDLTGISEYKNLISLMLAGCNLVNLDYIKTLPKLESLNLSNNKGIDLVGLGEYQNLLNLTLSGCNITDVNEIAKLEKLVALELGYNSITDISPLRAISTLEYVWLYNNEIEDISAVESWNNIYSLNLSNNRVTDISSLPIKAYSSLDLVANEIDMTVNSPSVQRMEQIAQLGGEIRYIA